MDLNNEEEEQRSSPSSSMAMGLRSLETVMRVVPMGLCLAAMAVMLKNSEGNDFGSVSYSDLTPFTYLVYADALCAAYSLFSAFFAAMPAGAAAAAKGPTSLRWAWTVFFFDQVLTYVILAAGTVSAEIVYLAYNGDTQVTWSKECSVFDGFCKKAMTSVAITFAAVACYVMLSLVSSYRLFSAYEAPIPFLAGKGGVEVAAFPR